MRKFLKFAIIGGLGSLTNLVLFAIFVDFMHGEALWAAILCYTAAATQNYFLNHYWTFRGSSVERIPPTFRQWGRFLISSLAGLVINLVVLQVTLKWFSIATFSQLLGISTGLLINFYMAKLLVFRLRPTERSVE